MDERTNYRYKNIGKIPGPVNPNRDQQHNFCVVARLVYRNLTDNGKERAPKKRE
jgi:hypothetical protein